MQIIYLLNFQWIVVCRYGLVDVSDVNGDNAQFVKLKLTLFCWLIFQKCVFSLSFDSICDSFLLLIVNVMLLILNAREN